MRKIWGKQKDSVALAALSMRPALLAHRQK